jgi:hypothetical protein
LLRISYCRVLGRSDKLARPAAHRDFLEACDSSTKRGSLPNVGPRHRARSPWRPARWKALLARRDAAASTKVITGLFSAGLWGSAQPNIGDRLQTADYLELPKSDCHSAVIQVLLLALQQAKESKGGPRRRYATRFSSFTSTSLHEVQETTIKGGRPSGRGTVRTSFIMPPQEGQRRIARLSAKTMGANPKNERACEVGELIAESAPELVAEKQRGRTLSRSNQGRFT